VAGEPCAESLEARLAASHDLQAVRRVDLQRQEGKGGGVVPLQVPDARRHGDLLRQVLPEQVLPIL
jgi:hypothetical protein